MHWTPILYLSLMNIAAANLGCVDSGTGTSVQVGSSCYQVVSEEVPRQTASERCSTEGGVLGIISDEVTLAALGNKVKVQSEGGLTSSTVFWLGMKTTGGRIVTESGAEVQLPVSLLQVSSELPTGTCVLLSLSSGEPVLTSADCSRSFWMYGYICQYPCKDCNSKAYCISSSRIDLLIILSLAISLLLIS